MLKYVKNDKLKPCPFCGSTDVRLAVYEDFMDGKSYSVYCKSCHVIIGNEDRHRSKERMISFWNKRVFIFEKL